MEVNEVDEKIIQEAVNEAYKFGKYVAYTDIVEQIEEHHQCPLDFVKTLMEQTKKMDQHEKEELDFYLETYFKEEIQEQG